jgi:hypothetical protein
LATLKSPASIFTPENKPSVSLKYRIHAGQMVLLETAIDRRHRMDNLTPLLISHALREARRRGRAIQPLSPAVRQFLAINHQP